MSAVFFYISLHMVLKGERQKESSGEWCYSLGLGYHSTADTCVNGLVLKVMIFEGVETVERSVQVEGRFLGHWGSGFEGE